MGIDIKDIEQVLIDHMQGQPYKAQCSACGYDLHVATEVDHDLDLKLRIDPCKNCLMEAAFDSGENK